MTETTRHRGTLAATIAGIVDRFGGAGDDLQPDTTTRLDGQEVLVTGGTQGLGRAIATDLARRGARVHIVGRSALDEAARRIGGAVVSHRCDLSDPSQVSELAKSLEETVFSRVVLNAGVVPLAARQSPVGTDLMVQVNFLAPVQLTRRLLAQGSLPRDAGARLVVVGSEAHRSAEPIAPDDLLTARDYGTREVVAEYGRSKLLLHTWVCELVRREAGHLAVHHLCPGAVDSNIAREAPGWMQAALKPVFRLFFQSPDRAAVPATWLAVSPTIDGETGIYLHMRRRRDPAALASDPARGAALWEAAHRAIDAWEAR